MMAVLGIKNVERNGHHYFRGLSVFPLELQRLALAEHSDLYHQPEHFPTLNIHKGKINITSLLQAPFGSKTKFPLKKWFTPDSSWNFESLHL